jgi:hypothetical protein
MINRHTLVLGAVAIALLSAGLAGEGVVQYRNFELKADAATIVALTGVAGSELKTIHERPAVIQDLSWRPSRWGVGSTAASTEAVEQIVFSFYNNQLSRIVVDYLHERTEGMTDADMTDALSAVYGAPAKRLPGVARLASQIEAESGTPVARWGDAEHTVVLYHNSTYGRAFRLIVTESALDGLSRKAAAQAARMEEADAPRREIARQKKELDDGRSAAEKARITNKAVFKP